MHMDLVHFEFTDFIVKFLGTLKVLHLLIQFRNDTPVFECALSSS